MQPAGVLVPEPAQVDVAFRPHPQNPGVILDRDRLNPLGAQGGDRYRSGVVRVVPVHLAAREDPHPRRGSSVACRAPVRRRPAVAGPAGSRARRHLRNATLVLYDVSSAAFEGRTCPLGALGHAKDGVHGRLQIVYGLLATPAGVPVAIEVFKGSTGDPATVGSQVKKLKQQFGISHLCVVGDRGMLTKARLAEDVRPAELDWITALRAPAIAGLVRSGAIQLSLFDETDLVEIAHPDYPAEPLVVCKNPLLAQERARKREARLAATEAELETIAVACRRERRPLRGKDKIALRVGKQINHYKMGSTSSSTSPTTRSASTATRTTSPPRPPSTGST